MNATALLKITGPVTAPKGADDFLGLAGIRIKLQDHKPVRLGDVLVVRAELREDGQWHGAIDAHIVGSTHQAPGSNPSAIVQPPPPEANTPPRPVAQPATPAAGTSRATRFGSARTSPSAGHTPGQPPARTPANTGARPPFSVDDPDSDIPF